MILPTIKEKKPKPKRDFMAGYKTYDTSEGFGSANQWKEAFEDRMNFCVLTVKDKEESKGLLGPLEDAFKTKDKATMKLAYSKLLHKYHPDIVGDSEINRRNTQLINERYCEMKTKLGIK